MLSLDPRSLIAMAFVMSALMSVILAFMRRHYPTHIRGVGYWAGAPGLWLISTVLYSSRGYVHPLFSVVLANVMLMGGSILYYIGCQRFLGFQSTWRGWVVFLIIAALAFTQLIDDATHYPLRLVVFTSLMLIIYGANLLFLLHHGGKRLPVRMVQIVLGTHMVVLLLRLISAVTGMAGNHIMEASPIQTLYISAYVLLILMLSIGAVLMATDRLVTELEYLATHDPLTHTLNRRALFERCHDELARTQRTGQRGPSILMLDLDHFKHINDTYGHQHGDAILAHFAQTTQSLLRRIDRLGRYGGEEFMLLLPDTDSAQAQVVAQRIHDTAACGHALDCKLSIGATTWQGPHDTLETMLARADAALYLAKASGRNQTCVG